MDLTTITTPYGLLDRDTQEALKAHGGPYECFCQREGAYAWRDDGVGGVSIETHSALAWRVKPAPPKPREWWAVGLHLHKDEATARAFLDQLNDEHPEMNFGPIIHVREVLPE